MLRLLLLLIAIALADAVNPATIVPALYFATTEHPRRHIAAFAGAFLTVNFLGGVILVLGPGQLLLSAVPHPSEAAKFAIEVIAGGALLLIGIVLLFGARNRRAEARQPEARGRAAGILGATIAAIELPTALPYFAAIAVVVGSGVGLASQLILVAVFNVVFISPVLAILVVLSVAGPSVEPTLRRIGDRLRAGWRRGAAWLAVAAGTLFVAFGATGFAGLH